MLKNKDLTDDELTEVIKKRSQNILERFGQIAVSGVNNSKLLAILGDVKNYWKDFSRPSLTSFSCEAVGGEPEMANDAALMFTIASAGIGIHDDLIDRSLNKHFRMTIQGLHGFDSALLVGDLLIVKAWTLVHEMIRKTSRPTRIADIVEAYGNFSVEICEAEFMETLCRRNLEIDLEYCQSILWKAMAETEACTKIGAIMGDGQADEVRALGEFGRRLGFISRLSDDVEDCLNLKGDLLHRIEYESVPLPLLYAAKSSREKHFRIKDIIEKPSLTSSDIKMLLTFCFETDAFDYVRKIAKENVRAAIHNLHSLRPSKARNALSLMIRKSYARLADLCI